MKLRARIAAVRAAGDHVAQANVTLAKAIDIGESAGTDGDLAGLRDLSGDRSEDAVPADAKPKQAWTGEPGG